MMNFILLIGLFNMLGGRWADLVGGEGNGGRLVLRCILPGIASGFLAPDLFTGIYICFAVSAGSALWFPWGWSFDEITGDYTAEKYPKWLQKIGLNLVPLGKSNRLRGVIMKGIRGAFDVLTFVLLIPINPFSLVLWLPTFLMGVVYWLSGILSPIAHRVMIAEFAWGICRGALIYLAIIHH